MKWGQNKKESVIFLAVLAFVGVGTYNAVVINSESSITSSDVRFVKRLDEMYGVVKPGREVANTYKWKKIASAPKPVVEKRVIQEVSYSQSAVVETVEPVVQAAIQQELSLNLVEVINSKKWPQGINQDNFTGNLATNNGTIESLSVALPNGEGISVSFAEMSGNVFEYDMDGEIYSGMLYQADQNSYMITLTNGPLEGTRLKFVGEQDEVEQPVEVVEEQPAEAPYPYHDSEQPQQEVVDNQQELVQNGPISDQEAADYDRAMQEQSIEQQSYNFEQQT